jgi:hypothetical protein
MFIENHILAPEYDELDVRSDFDPTEIVRPYLNFFDDTAAVMYRKIDTTLLIATSLTVRRGPEKSFGLRPDPTGLSREVTMDECCIFIPSRMTHRLLFAPAGAPSERMIP